MLKTILSPRRYPWFLERFVNVMVIGEYNFEFYFTDLKSNKMLRPMMEAYCFLNFNEVEDASQLIKYIDAALNREYYCNVWVDKQYVPDTDEYQVCNYFHPVLIYGKDEDYYYLVDFSDSKGVFKHTISTDNLIKAVNSVKQIESLFAYYAGKSPLFESFKIDKEAEKYDFSLCRFSEGLYNYLNSRNNIFEDEKGRERFATVYGINTYERIILFCENHNLYTLSFKSLFDMRYHKQFLVDRLIYISSNYIVSSDFYNYIERLMRVYYIFDRIVNMNMRYCLRNKLPPNIICGNNEFFKKTASLLREAENIERETLTKVLAEINRMPKDKYYPFEKLSENGACIADWDFSQNRTFNFINEGDCEDIEFDDGISLLLNGISLCFVHRHVDIDAKCAKNVLILLKNEVEKSDLLFDFTTYENVDFDDTMSVNFDVSEIGEYNLITLNMANHELWKGKILDIRIRMHCNERMRGRMVVKRITIK